MSSKAARLRRRQAIRKRRAKRGRLTSPARAAVMVVPLRPGPVPDEYAVSKPRVWSALAGVGAASVFTLLPPGHVLMHHSGRPFFAAAVAGAVSTDRTDYLHADGLEWMEYQLGPQMGTARTDILIGPVDPWSGEVARYRYGSWGPNLYGD